MIKTVFSKNKGFYIPNGYEDIDEGLESEEENIAPIVTNGFDVLQWPNGFNNLIAGNDVNDESDDQEKEKEVIPTNSKLRTRLSKQERKELRKAKREQRKLGLHKNKNIIGINGSNPKDERQTLKLRYDKGMKVEKSSFLMKETTIYKEDLYTLQVGEWLNDNIITYCYSMLYELQIKPFEKKFNLKDKIVLLTPSMCYLLANSNLLPLELKTILPSNIVQSSFLILPLNDGGSHWSLLVVAVADAKVFAYDSLIGSNEEESKILIKKLNFFFNENYNSSKPAKKHINWDFKYIPIKSAPQQKNEYDCGIFVIALTCVIISKLINAKEKAKIDLSLKEVRDVDTISSRNFIMGSILNELANKGLIND
ncbi:hypothetical protein PACTADRAFT_16230 [Pachysolen tannophilus NRRL Y-2460]|uniref:Ubiquitin-like protease family profile domain-containing protein n=1 Tax=Pachysolen tannophilus NRRL Y-2460 TaxID=669874 RepID=A0A1E4TWE7_PACTA|nr:hypothetical protein PACTADRAFT_16230 [Pachysolen tannophilus NRRL Y-2460]